MQLLIGRTGKPYNGAPCAQWIEKVDDSMHRQAHFQNAMETEQALELQRQAAQGR